MTSRAKHTVGAGDAVAVVECPTYEAATVRSAVAAALEALQLSLPVRPGDTVLVKPNLLSPRLPEQAVTTHPEVVATVIRLCFEAGAGRVWVGDSCAGDHADEELWRKTGIATAVAETGAELKSFNAEVRSWACGETQLPVPAWFDQVDAWISLPKLKTHVLTGLTCAMKNTYGLVAGKVKSLYHASHASPRAMSLFLLDVYQALPPSFVVVDAVTAMEGQGPANGQPREVGLILAGTDAAAIDLACAGTLGNPFRHAAMLRQARDSGLVVANASRLTLVGDGVDRLKKTRLKPSLGRYLQRVPECVFRSVTRVLACRPRVDPEACVGCGVCARVCSQNAIAEEPNGDSFRINAARCIMCMCCAESCPQHAIYVKSPLKVFSFNRNRGPT